MEKYLYAYNIFTFLCLLISGIIIYLNRKLIISQDFSKKEKSFLSFTVFTVVTTILFSYPFTIWKEVGLDILMFIGFCVFLTFFESIPAFFISGWRTITRQNDDWEFLGAFVVNLCMIGYLYGIYRLDTYLNPVPEDAKAVTIGELANSLGGELNNTSEYFLLPMTVILIVFISLFLVFKKKENK